MTTREIIFAACAVLFLLGWAHALWLSSVSRANVADAIQMTREAQTMAREVLDLAQCVELGNEVIERLDLCETSAWACEKLDDDLLRECAERPAKP